MEIDGDRIRLRIFVGDKDKEQSKAIVKKVTHAHEVVEVDGFVFKRRRKTIAEPVQPPAAPSAHKTDSPVDGLVVPSAQRTKSPATQLGFTTPASRTLLAASDPPQDAQQAEPPPPQLPEILTQPFRSNSLELTCLTMSAAQMHLQHLPPSLQEQLQPVLQDVADRFSSSLRTRLRPTASQVQQESGTPAKPAASSRLYKELLKQQLSKLRAQRRAWEALQHKYCEAEPEQQAEGAERPAAEQQAHQLELAELGCQLHASLALKVEAMQGMVDKVEDLVSDAEKAGRMLQGIYHRDKFGVFPHVGSPLLLLKMLTQPTQPSQQ